MEWTNQLLLYSSTTSTLAHKGATLARKGTSLLSATTTLAHKDTTGPAQKPYGFLYGPRASSSSNHYSLVSTSELGLNPSSRSSMRSRDLKNLAFGKKNAFGIKLL